MGNIRSWAQPEAQLLDLDAKSLATLGELGAGGFATVSKVLCRIDGKRCELAAKRFTKEVDMLNERENVLKLAAVAGFDSNCTKLLAQCTAKNALLYEL